MKVVAEQVIQGVPLCKACAHLYANEKDVLRDAREFLRDLEPEQPAPEYVMPPVKQKCLCGCGTTIPDGHKYAPHHVPKPPEPLPPSNHPRHREPDKPLPGHERKPEGIVKHKPDGSVVVLNVNPGREPKAVKPAQEIIPVALCFCGRPARHRGRHLGTVAESEPRTVIDRSVTRREIVTREPASAARKNSEDFTTGTPRVSKLHIELPSGGHLSLEWEGYMFEISAEDRNFIFAIADRMRSYAKQRAVPMPAKNFQILGGIEGGYLCDMFDCLDQEQQNTVVAWMKEAVEVVKERSRQ